MRILLESFDLNDLGGSGTSLRCFAEDWRRRGADVVACPTVLSLEQTRKIAPDLVVSQQRATARAAEVADALRIPLVALVHGAGQLVPTPMTRMAIFCSQTLADAEPAIHLEDRESVVVAPPVPAARYAADGPGSGGVHLTLTSSDDYVKGVDRFLQVARELPEYPFLLVADGEYPEAPGNVTVRQRTPDVRTVYADTRLLLLPSRSDSAPRVLVEAAMSGIPALASDLPGVHEVSLGLTRVVRDGEDWAQAVRRALAEIDDLRPRTAELAAGYLARQATQFDECWRKMQRVADARVHDALLGLVMIVRDEARGIRETLESVLHCVDWWTIVDTGSTDGTPEIVQEVMAGVPGELRRAPFVNFSTTRNLALSYCEPRARFALMLSGDEVLDRTDGRADALRQFCIERRDPDPTDPGAYDLTVQFGTTTTYKSPRLTRSGAGWRYEGVTHEALVGSRGLPGAGPPGVVIRHERLPEADDDAGGSSRARRRWEQDLALLSAAAKRKPGDTRTAFYLAQTLECLDRKEEAVDAYRRRIGMGGWQEEVYESLARVARLRQALGHPWEQVQQAYLDAHAHSPHRAEPLVAVARHWYDQGNHALSFLFAQRAAQIPYPTQSRLFIDADVYRWQAHDLVSVAAFYLGLHDVGRAAAEAAAQACPGDARLQNNLDLYRVQGDR